MGDDDHLVSGSAKYLPVTTLRFNNDKRYASLVNSKLVPDTVVSDAVNLTWTGAGVDGPCSSSARAFSEPAGSPNVDNSVSNHTKDGLSADLHNTCVLNKSGRGYHLASGFARTFVMVPLTSVENVTFNRALDNCCVVFSA